MNKRQHFSFFQNKECEFFPCHKGVPEEDFNCLFCYCPLYALGRKCGGSCTYTAQGYKDCQQCVFPHIPENYHALLARYEDVMAVVRESDSSQATKDCE